jgi:hypothetical protein
VPKLHHLSFFKFFYLLVLLFSPLIRLYFLYSIRRVELSSTIIVLTILELKSFTLILILLLSLKNLYKVLIFIVEELVLN